MASKITIPVLKTKKAEKVKITMLTAYDYPTALMVDEAGVDMVLVGDSLGMVMLGYESTVPVTMDEMVHHIKAVRRGLKNALLVGDMPFMSYNVSPAQAVENAGRLMKEGGADMIKLEGGVEAAPAVKAIVDAGIPVCGHIGLTPQSVAKLGGYKVQGKDLSGAQKQIDAAKAIEEAGADALVMECIPGPLAKAITGMTGLVTIGIGAGPDCDGQVLVTHDMLGVFTHRPPKMVRQYAQVHGQMVTAMSDYIADCKSGSFPAPEHGFVMDEAILKDLKF